MRFASVASGSSGNCLYAGNDDTHILIDAGVSRKRREEGLKGLGRDGSDIKALLITHEHTDHIRGLGVWSRKYHIPVYATRGTIEEIKQSSSLGTIDESLFRVIRPEEDFFIDNIQIHPFSVSHDARDPVGYTLQEGDVRIGTVTDLGYFDQSVVRAVSGCSVLYVEANHDLRMLETGRYPYQLKRRIAGNYGHLCNEDCGRLIGEVLNERLQTVVLGHLSKENNFPELALAAVKNQLMEDHPQAAGKFTIKVAPRERALAMIEPER